MTSPFLSIPSERWLCANGVAFAFPDNYPVSPGHSLIVTRRVVPTWFDATREEQLGILDLIDQVKALLDGLEPRPDGYNVGFNAGVEAGQTVMHLHVHVIPRYQGDMPDPRGGVRHVIPWKGNYKVLDSPRLVTGGLEDPFLETIAPLWQRSTRVSIISAFVRQSGLGLLRPFLEGSTKAGGARFRILTGDYLGITQPEALEQLRGWEALFEGRVEVRVIETVNLPGASRSFHPKSWIFESPEGDVAFVGSSNVSRSALESGIEWNLRLDRRLDPAGWDRVAEGFEAWWERGCLLTPEWLADYRDRAAQAPSTAPEILADPSARLPEPHRLQAEALLALEASRRAGHGRALVVMATGLGKTLVAALDAVAMAKELGRMPRILVLAHREELLAQASSTFQLAFWEGGYKPRSSWFAGPQGDLEGDLVFAMVQKLGRREHLARLGRMAFDYVFVDEAHHSEAESYRRILGRLEPLFLLGVTATPERADGADLTGLFDDHVAFQADLGLGIQEGLLAPFAYIGLKDETDYTNIPWRNRRFDPEQLAAALATQRRMEKLWEGWQAHPGTRTLVFCCSIEHAEFSRDWLSGMGVRTAAIHSGPDSANRASALKAFRAGELEALCVVDLFNEGVDIPTVDRVVMLRPTESPVIFLQQLGRGLRRSVGKAQLKVLDFVGNHRVFLDRMRVLFSAVDRSFKSVGCWLDGQAPELPPGCEVEVEWEVKELLRALLPAARGVVGADLLERVFDEQVAAREVRPTAGELFRMGYDIEALRRDGRDWFTFLKEKGCLQAQEEAVAIQAKDWLAEVQTTRMEKSFKMVTLEVLLETDALATGMPLTELAEKSWYFLRRSPELLKDLQGVKSISDTTTTVPPATWPAYWMQNPILHWTNKGELSWFRVDAGRFEPKLPPVPGNEVVLAAMTRELVDYRLAKYRARSREPLDGSLAFQAKVIWNGHTPILKLPSADTRPRDTVQARLPDDAVWAFRLMAEYCNVAHPVGEPGNRLPELMRDWFGPDAGKPGTQFRVQFSRAREGWSVRPVVV